MKKYIIFTIILMVIILSGCAKLGMKKDIAIPEDNKLRLPQIEIIQLNENESEGVYSRKNDLIFCHNSLIKEVDIDSFLVYKNSGYAKDNKNIYFPIEVICANCPGCGCFCEKYIVSGVDIQTFKVLNNGYAKDNNFAYYNGLKLNDVNIDSFTIINSTSVYFFAAKDKNNVFIQNKKINADPNTFEYLDERDIDVWMKDKKNVWTMLKSDSSSIQIVEKADPSTFKLISTPKGPNVSGNEHYALDKNHAYFLNKIIEDSDSKTFEPLSIFISKDKNNAYASGNKIIGVDIKTFEVINSHYSKDKNNVYYLKNIVKDADPETFKP